MADLQPETTREYLGLAATQIRRTLLDLTRHHFGPHGLGANHHTDKPDADELAYHQATCEPDDLGHWVSLHEAVEALPDDEREVFGLLWYSGLSQAEAGEILGVHERTIRRRWLAARTLLYELLDGESPI